MAGEILDKLITTLIKYKGFCLDFVMVKKRYREKIGWESLDNKREGRER